MHKLLDLEKDESGYYLVAKDYIPRHQSLGVFYIPGEYENHYTVVGEFTADSDDPNCDLLLGSGYPVLFVSKNIFVGDKITLNRKVYNV